MKSGLQKKGTFFQLPLRPMELHKICVLVNLILLHTENNFDSKHLSSLPNPPAPRTPRSSNTLREDLTDIFAELKF